MDEALYKATGDVMHAASMFYHALTEVHQGVCEGKGQKAMKTRVAAAREYHTRLTEAFALWHGPLSERGLLEDEG